MATGYTHNTAEGTGETLAEFVANCARAMGLYVMMRDEPDDAPLTVDTERSFYDDALAKEMQEYQDLLALTEAQVCDAYLAARDQANNSVYEQNQRASEVKQRYQKRLDEVNSLTFPEGEFFDGLRNFMIEQLQSSIDFDCKPVELWFNKTYPTVDAWWVGQVDASLRAIIHYAEQARKEREAHREKQEAHNTFMGFLSRLEKSDNSEYVNGEWK